MNLTATRNFVTPYYIDELGKVGLVAADIAMSIEVSASNVRGKLKKGFLERIKVQGLQAVKILRANKITGIEFEEIALELLAAKFFVIKYENETADAYAIFLARMEQNLVDQAELVSKDPLLAQIESTRSLRVQQIRQEVKLKEHDSRLIESNEKIAEQKIRIEELEEVQGNSYLSTTQKKTLKELIDRKAYDCGGIRLCGIIEKGIKIQFGLNMTNDRWYHVAQKDYERAINYVRSWSRGL